MRNPTRLGSQDPISMHLLMETALDDSQQYEVISPEEMDALKKVLQNVKSRIEGTKRKLVLETKLRDAAQSINRLHPGKSRESSLDNVSMSPKKHRRSAISKGSNYDLLGKSDNDVRESTRKCEELAQELWQLEKQEQDLQRRFLEHTAGILQMTHKGYLVKEPLHNDGIIRSLSNGHLSQDSAVDFGDQSNYHPYTGSEDMGWDVHEGPKILSSPEYAQQTQMVIDVENKVEDLNERLRDMILELKPPKEDLPIPPRELNDDPSNPTEILWGQVEFLEKCIDIFNHLHASRRRGLEDSNLDTEEVLEKLNSQLHNIMAKSNPEEASTYIPPPKASGESLQDQLDYLEGGLAAINRRIQQLGEASQNSSQMLSMYDQRAERYESVIGGLWDILMDSEQNARQKDDGQGSVQLPVEDFSLQAFSIKVQALHEQSIALKEQEEILYKQLQQQRELNENEITEKDAKITHLSTDVEQAHLKIDALGKEVISHREELVVVAAELAAAKQADILREQQKQADENEALNAERQARKEAEQHMFTDLSSKQDIITQLELQLQQLQSDTAQADLRTKLETAEQSLHRLNAQHEETKERAAVMEVNALTLRSDLEEKTSAATKAQEQTKKQEAEMARLQTELTVAQAELDSAHGTRTQRAAEIPVDPSVQEDIENLTGKNMALTQELAALRTSHTSNGSGSSDFQARMNTLQRELNDTISDYEAMTKASFEFDKEREQLENLVDSLRDRIEDLEGQLSDERVQMLGVKSLGGSGSRDSVIGGSTSTMVLKNEFKKMMRETRAEYAKAMRVSRISLCCTCVWKPAEPSFTRRN